MIYGSVCSGIEAATVAWHPLGWVPAWFSEIEKFPCRVLAHHYPQVPNLGNMLKITKNPIFKNANIDVLVGGTPCQSFSIAGLRAGLASKNGNLALEYCRILQQKQPRWFVWENVPGALSSYSYAEGSERMDRAGHDDGREITETADFATILTAFRECGYSCAYRVLDAQYYGVPQRRRRIFVIGYLGDDWRPSAAVLFEPQSLRRNIAKGGKTGEKVTGTLGNRSKGRGYGPDEAAAGHVIPTITARPYADNESTEEKLVVHTLTGNGHDASEDGSGRGTPIVPCWWDGGQVSQTLDRVLSKGQMMPEKNRFPCVLYSIMPMNSSKDYKAREVDVTQPITRQIGVTDQGGDVILQAIDLRNGKEDPKAMSLQAAGMGKDRGLSVNAIPHVFQSSQSGVREADTAPTLDANWGSRRSNGIVDALSVRRLTPLECERLQGFPDEYTNIPEAADSPRYSAIGNSMAVDVMEWLGRRIDAVDKQLSI